MDFTKTDEFLDGLCGTLVPSNDLIIRKDHEIIHRHACGFLDAEAKIPVCEDALYYMYSATKPVTCAAALMLYEKGLFSLDDPLYEYMPEFRDMNVIFEDADGKKKTRKAKSPILIRHLFSMTAGFDYNTESSPLREAKKIESPRCPTRNIISALAKVPLSFDPGTKWQYGLCHDVLAALVGEISGKAFAAFVFENILKPLGMNSSFFHLNDELAERIAPQYMYFDNEKTFRRTTNANEFIFGTEYDSGGAGMISSTEDMSIFADALACGGTAANGYRLLREETVRMMRTNVLTEDMLPSFDWTQYRGYGYGLGVRTLITHDTGALSNLGEFGWAGAAGAYMLCDNTEKLSVFCARHMLNNKEPFITPNLRNLIYEGLAK